ncbi:MAG: glycoside hydrolase family 3 C-terminal domain-containing protein [Duncaniella sp.]|nr:glycoside hydrolase family 3 C-terminal domain-containing protein [Duncaniella sp.]
MNKSLILSVLLASASLMSVNAYGNGSIYHKGWIDFNKNGVKDVYEDPAAPVQARIDDLLSQMTMDEKTCQLTTLYGSGRVLKDSMPTPQWKNEIWKDGIANIDEQANGLGTFQSALSYPYTTSISNRQAIQRWFVEETRLGIPVDFTNEGIRGLNHDRATMFPAQCGQGSTWDRSLISEIARVTAEEANALGYTNIYAPLLDISQDPRWGRVVECYSEDPYLTGELGKEMILGLQSRGLVSTPKHFAVYSIPVGGRDGGTRTDPHVAPREMRTLYLEPFRKAVCEAKVKGIMSSYNDYDGIPVTGSSYFLTDILRKEWGFDGYVVSDSEAVEFLQTKHHVAADAADAAGQAINAGLNVRTNFTPPENFILPLREAIARKLVSEETINARVADVLRVKFNLGLFDSPYTGDASAVNTVVHSPEHQAVSKRAALESIVLLKNEGHLLPLDKNIRRVAVIGPNADETTDLICRYGPANAPIKSVYRGIKEYLPQADVRYAKGADIIDSHFPESELYDVPLDSLERAMMDEAVSLAKSSDIAIMVLGGNERTVREEYSRTSLNLAGRQEKLLQEVYATGTPVVLVMVDGRAATINWADRYIPSIIHAWFPGEFMGQAIAEVLWGDYNPGGKLAVTFPRSVGQIPFAFPMKPGSDTDGHVRVAHTLYPFGYGLSYTDFEYSGMTLSHDHIAPDDSVTVTVSVKNTGSRTGDEVVQLYVRDDVSSVITYVKTLRGFERITLAPGEMRRVSFTLTPRSFALIDRDNKFTVEPGTFTIMAGTSSEDIKLTEKLTIDQKIQINPSEKSFLTAF